MTSKKERATELLILSIWSLIFLLGTVEEFPQPVLAIPMRKVSKPSAMNSLTHPQSECPNEPDFTTFASRE